MLTKKRFQTSCLIDAADCPSDTFRSWRNRNGLFPETQDTGKWNRFSIIDIMIAAIVTDLIKTGISAQFAVDAGMAAGPLLASLAAPAVATKTEEDVFTLVGQLLEHWEKNQLPVLVIEGRSNRSPTVKILKSLDAVDSALGPSVTVIIVQLAKVLRFSMARLAVYDSEFDYSSGRRRVSHKAIAPGLWKASKDIAGKPAAKSKNPSGSRNSRKKSAA